MKTLNLKVITTAVFCVFLTTACSKKLMPPEIETSAATSEETDVTASSESSFAGSGGGAEDAGSFSEEPIMERGPVSGGQGGFAGETSGGSSTRSADSGITDGGRSSEFDFGSGSLGGPGNGSTGSFSANPFVSGDSSSGSSAGSAPGSSAGSSESMASEIQESRLQSFQASADLKDIHFEFDQYDLDMNSRKILKENAEFLKRNPNVQIEIQGHCDERGTNNYNIALGERRAHSTKKYLVSQGVDSRKVHIISYGEEKPFCFESQEACWYQNRRAHFMVSK